MTYELIISEKPQAAEKIAKALADKTPSKHRDNNVNFFSLTHKGKQIRVASAVGHLYILGEMGGESWTYPIFNTEWKPIYKVNKAAKYTSDYIKLLTKLGKEADEVTIASDFDIEGEVIGLNVVRYALKRKDANRMKFSTLTKPDLIKAYETKQTHLEWGQAKAGETRHTLDWYYGINLSRAFTQAIKKGTNQFKVLSTGRVQAPALHFLAEREKKIAAFIPEKFSEIYLDGNCEKTDIRAQYELPEDKIKERKAKIEEDQDDEDQNTKTIDKTKVFDSTWAKQVVEETKNKNGTISDITAKQFKQAVPTPFDLTSLQMEASTMLGLSPKRTLEIAQKLYIEGITSYPRTSSQKLPKELNLKSVLEKLEKQPIYRDKVKLVYQVNPQIKPKEGKKEDAAHPAIHPTGEVPKKLEGQDQRLYDLIVKRFFAVFGKDAIRETNTIKIDINSHTFVLKGTRTIERNWHDLYEPYLKFEDVELPKLHKDAQVINKKIEEIEKETSPPKRYTDASIIKELEKRSLGTKCLAGSTKINLIEKTQIKEITLKDLFNKLSKNSQIITEDKTHILINNKNLKCFSFCENKQIQSQFTLISKRKLNNKEKVYELIFSNGEKIIITENHPILIKDSENFNYKKTSEIIEGEKAIQATTTKTKYNNHLICDWEEFIKKNDEKSKLFATNIDFKKIRSEKTQNEFGKKYNLTQSRIAELESKKSIPLYLLKKIKLEKPKFLTSTNKNLEIKNPFPLYYTPEIARILANLIGDASIDTKKIEKENCYDFRYHNTNLDLINRFKEDIKTLFGLDLEIKQAKEIEGHLPKYYLNLPSIIGRIIAILFPQVITKDFIDIPQEFILFYLGALFDDEGFAGKDEPKAFISHTNFKLMEKLKLSFEKLEIKTTIDKKQFKLHIRGRENLENFLNIIPIASINKKQRIINSLSNNYNWKEIPSNQIYKQILLELLKTKNKKLTCPQISEKIGINEARLRDQLKKLIEKKILTKETIGISKYPGKEIHYKLNKNIYETYLKYISEKVISQDYSTTTLISKKEIDFDEEVYDITNCEEIPNFTLSSGLIVHNSTRAEILNNLRNRGFVIDKSIKVTELGMSMDEVLSQETPILVDEQLTRHFEEEMEKIREEKSKPETILGEAKEKLEKILDEISKKEKELGIKLADASKIARAEAARIASCPNCEDGTLVIRQARATKKKFIACDKYPNCKTIFNAPQTPILKGIDDMPDEDGNIFVYAGKTEGNLQKILINPKEEQIQNKEKKYEEEDMLCPNCKKGHMKLRKSFYGEFLGCNNYPKCKTMMKIIAGKVDTNPISPAAKKPATKKKTTTKKPTKKKE